jgi:hypothetical protein
MSSKIRLKQGEAKTITLTATRQYGEAVDLTGATLFFGVKRHKKDTAYIFSKVDADFDKTEQVLGIVTVDLSITDTSQAVDDYHGELKCTWAGTVVKVAKSLNEIVISIEKSGTT